MRKIRNEPEGNGNSSGDSQLQLWDDLPETENNTLVFSGLKSPVWTENKAKLIAEYLRLFVQITKHGAYIDGFAGPQEPDDGASWAAKLVLESQPKFLRDFWLCERDRKKLIHLDELASTQPPLKKIKRRVEVLPGDFNISIDGVLSSGRIKNSTASFCLVDQHTFECAWETVQKIARHKTSTKIEIFYFLATGWLDRAMAAITKGEQQVDRWWGGPDWRHLQGMNGGARADLVCRRFNRELGYKFAYAWPIYSRGAGGNVMFHMIHATDHPEAPKIMARAYRIATNAPDPSSQLLLELPEAEGE